jgi:protein-L-isoaspartate(D-aspartate) O-methyltransferase
MNKRSGFIGLLLLAAGLALAATEEEYRAQRLQLVQELEREGIQDKEVLAALRKVPRHEFVPERERSRAYANHPLPIGYGQTISQPYIVGYMTEMLDVDKDDVVLEIGTGSGYQAAILAEIVKKVYTIEIVKPLYEQAQARLKRLKYKNVEVKQADGYYGWKEHAPFDAIIVTATAAYIPPPLIEQLKPGGKMAIPVGSVWETQNLVLVEKGQDGKVRTQNKLPVLFVPMTGKILE